MQSTAAKRLTIPVGYAYECFMGTLQRMEAAGWQPGLAIIGEEYQITIRRGEHVFVARGNHLPGLLFEVHVESMRQGCHLEV